MKYAQFIFLLFLCSYCSSCNEKAVDELEIIRTYSSIDVPAKALIDSVSFVKLETREGNLIGEVSKLLFTDSMIIIIDKAISKSIYVFSTNGHFIRKIGTFGQGPTEYNYICDVILSYDKTKLHVLSRRKLITYNLNGTFISNQDTKSLYHLIENIDDKTFALVNMLGVFESKKSKKNNLLQIVDNNFNNIIYSGVESSFRPGGILMGYADPLINVNGKVFLLPNLSDTIFEVSNKEVFPRYFIKAEKQKPNSSEIIQSAKNGNMSLGSRFNGGFYHIDDYIIIDMIFSPRPLVFYNTKTKKTYSFDVYKIKDTHPLLAFANTLKTQYKSSLVTVASTADILSSKDGFYKSYDKKMIDSLLENMTEDDNPVLLFYHVNNKEPR